MNLLIVIINRGKQILKKGLIMNLYKKDIILLGLILVSGADIHSFGEFEKQPQTSRFTSVAEAAQSLMIAHANLFNGPALTKQITPQYNRWIGDLAELEGYVYVNVKNNDKLMNAAQVIRSVGKDLADIFQFGVGREKLSTASENLQTAKQGIEGFGTWFWGEKEKEIKELLLELIGILKRQIDAMK